MTQLTVAAVAANFGRDLKDAFARIEILLDDARARGASLVVLPEATLGGYLTNLSGAGAVSLSVDLGGGWRPGYTGRQWDSTTHRSSTQLQQLTGLVARNAPAAAKDVSMAGVVGTLGMLAESSGCGAVLDVAAVPRPDGVSAGDWLTCFPGFAMVTTDRPGRPITDRGAATTAACGELTTGAGVALRWPDGELTEAITAGVTGLGAASPQREEQSQ